MGITLRSISKIASILAITASLPFSNVYAKNFALPSNSSSLLGDIQFTIANADDSPTTVAQRYNIGLNSVIAANPGANEHAMFQAGTPLKIATQFMLPPVQRHGIVINLPEMRLYYFPEGTRQVMTFPIGIGKIGKTIPIKNTSIIRKIVNPTWTPPADIREFNQAQGIQLPKSMGPGPDNPLGPYAIYLGIPTYLIHSTIFPESIGRRASFGCIRMNESDIKQFFPLVTAGTPVEIIDMPYKVAWNSDQLYLEAHPPLEERSDVETASLGGIVKSIENQMSEDQVTLVNWQLVAYLAEQPDGIPHDIGVKL